MYLGAGLALGGAALCFESIALAGYAGLFILLTHAFVRLYENPRSAGRSETNSMCTAGRSGGGCPGCDVAAQDTCPRGASCVLLLTSEMSGLF